MKKIANLGIFFGWVFCLLSTRDLSALDGGFTREYKDPDTGARVIHLSRIANSGSGVIYFTQACSSPDGRYTIVRYLDVPSGHTVGNLYRYDFKTGELLKLTDRLTRYQVLAPNSGNLYYISDDKRAIYLTNIYTLKTRKVTELSSPYLFTDGLTVNSKETTVVAVGGLASEHKNERVLTTPPNQGTAFQEIFDHHYTNLLLATEIRSGRITELHRISTWLGHVQFSPTDPTLLMYCHEGPWAKVDRIWLLRLTAGSRPNYLLKRMRDDEIIGHEFWSSDGSVIWFDHNFRDTPGKHFLEGRNILTGAIIRYPISSSFASVHYTLSPDRRFFVGDGSTNKLHPGRQAMYLLLPKKGSLRAIELCNMSGNNYKVAEPNPHVTPDQHWVTFTATFSGTSQAYAVELPKEYWR